MKEVFSWFAKLLFGFFGGLGIIRLMGNGIDLRTHWLSIAIVVIVYFLLSVGIVRLNKERN